MVNLLLIVPIKLQRANRLLWLIAFIFLGAYPCMAISDNGSNNKLDEGKKNKKEKSEKTNTETRNMWGIHFNATPFHNQARCETLDTQQINSNLPILISQTKALGVSWARVAVDWGTAEDSLSNFCFNSTDRIVDGLSKNGIQIYMSLSGGHPTHTRWQPPRTPKQMMAWLRWLDAITLRYGKTVKYWELWNEPNSTWFWGGKPNPEEYFNLVEKSSAVIRKNVPNSIIIGGSLARTDVPFSTVLFSKGIEKHIDVFSFHPYGASPELNVLKHESQVAPPHWYLAEMGSAVKLAEIVKKANPAIELWQGECGYPSGYNSKGWQGPGPFNHNVQGKWIIRRAITDIAFGAKVSSYFCLHEFGDEKALNSKGLLSLQTLEPKPAFNIYQNVIKNLNENYAPTDIGKVKFEFNDFGSYEGMREKDIFTVAFKGTDGSLFFAYWLPVRFQEGNRPAKITLQLPEQYSATEVLDLFNNKKDNINQRTYKGILTDYPIILRLTQSVNPTP